MKKSPIKLSQEVENSKLDQYKGPPSKNNNTLFPDLIDNIEGNTLSKALKSALKDSSDISEVCIATAFFTSAGFFQIIDELATAPSVRLLIGAEFLSQKLFLEKPVGETKTQFQKNHLQESLKFFEKGIRWERDHLNFSLENERKILSLIKVLKERNIEIRRYEKEFLHAKAYIVIKGHSQEEGGIVIGSSNMTKAGMTTNLELNASRLDKKTVARAKDWFDSLWKEAVPFELTGLFEEALSIKAPFEIFIRVLWELYGKEIESDFKAEKGLSLTDFQKHGVIRALRLLNEYNGAIVADEVGLGKTFIAGEIIEIYKSRRHRALLICPAALRDSVWKTFRTEHQVFIECVSYEELSRDQQLNKKSPDVSEKLQRKIEEYQLIVVDEAHNYRNPSAPMRADILRRLLFGKKKDLLLLTATPVNNSLWDLYHLIHFFIKQDAFMAKKGILSLKGVFREAMKEDPANLSPDKLFPIIDATTVKRTRHFIQKHYKNDTIKLPNGQPEKISFPKPKVITVRYSLDQMIPFESMEKALDPESPDKILFSRYTPDRYLKTPAKEKSQWRAEGIAGLLRSNLLKRFESSLFAFSNTVGRMAKQHELFLEALNQGQVISSKFLQELSGDDETALKELLQESPHTQSAKDYHKDRLKQDVKRDLSALLNLKTAADKVTRENDQKLKALIKELKKTAKLSMREESAEKQRDKRKTLIFSFFADTVEWIFKFLEEEIKKHPDLAEYKGRIAAVTGSDHKREGFNLGMRREAAVQGFAPRSMESESDNYDILITTDVLAEGVNLQQCCHIINYDLPWNPMRLVQRHGRIDRIGSPHREVFLKTIFPADKLDVLLGLEQRILNKLALAARSVGVVSPIEGESGGKQVFSETREEINKLLKENPSLFERGGTASSAQTGEEYRQTLRKALKENRDKIINLPWKSGSGMLKGKQQGIFFCATIGEKRTYLRFVPADNEWSPHKNKKIIKELGTCLRLIEAEKETETFLPEKAKRSVYDFWNIAKTDILKAWMYETDPANLQPKIQKINREVADFIRQNKAFIDTEEQKINQALEIVESPWPRREESLLREQFNDDRNQGKEKAKKLIDWILDTGLEPLEELKPLPPVFEEDIKLICWMAVASE